MFDVDDPLVEFTPDGNRRRRELPPGLTRSWQISTTGKKPFGSGRLEDDADPLRAARRHPAQADLEVTVTP